MAQPDKIIRHTSLHIPSIYHNAGEHMKPLIAALALISTSAIADTVYFEGGFSYSSDWHEHRRDFRHSGLHGTVEIGYRMGDISIYGLHISDPTSLDDDGINMMGVKYRVEFD